MGCVASVQQQIQHSVLPMNLLLGVCPISPVRETRWRGATLACGSVQAEQLS